MRKWIFLLALVFIAPAFSKSNLTTTVFADALYWQMRESNATNWAQILTPASSNETIEFLSVPFKWSPGLRVGVGLKEKEKPWNPHSDPALI